MYVELHAASAFSFLEGASVPEELAAVCAEHGMAAMAVVDRDGVYGAPRFHLAMKKAGMKAHIGSEITVSGFEASFSNFSAVDRRFRTDSAQAGPSQLGNRKLALDTGNWPDCRCWLPTARATRIFAGW